MMRTAVCIAGVIALTFPMACSADSEVVTIWPGVAPGSENWTHKERTADDTPIGTVVFNVVTPTLRAYVPEPTRATGAGVIIAPRRRFRCAGYRFGREPGGALAAGKRHRRVRAPVSAHGKASGGHSGD